MHDRQLNAASTYTKSVSAEPITHAHEISVFTNSRIRTQTREHLFSTKLNFKLRFQASKTLLSKRGQKHVSDFVEDSVMYSFALCEWLFKKNKIKKHAFTTS